MTNTTPSMQNAISLCEANGLVNATTKVQANHGTLRFVDPLNTKETKDFYTITATGYVRRHLPTGSPYYGPAKMDMYQLNKVIQVPFTYGDRTYIQPQRVLRPGQYEILAETLVRVALKRRKAANA